MIHSLRLDYVLFWQCAFFVSFGRLVMTDLIQRLRSTRADMLGTDDEDHYWDCHEAAKALEAKDAQIDQLDDEIINIEALAKERYCAMQTEIERLQAVVRAIRCEFEEDSWQRRDLDAALGDEYE